MAITGLPASVNKLRNDKPWWIDSTVNSKLAILSCGAEILTPSIEC